MARGNARAKDREPANGGAGGDDAPDDAPDSEAVALGAVMLRELAGTLWLPEGLSQAERSRHISVAMKRLKRINPKGALEGLLATQMVATHSAAMDCLRRAMLGGQTFEGRNLNLKHAAKLLSLYARQVEVLDKHRGKGQQKVTVEHVHVEAGGQAIVGNVEAGGRKRRPKRGSAAIEHAPEAPLENPAPAKNAKRRR